jgi:hypothetical protein
VNLQPHQQRVVDELTELDTRITKLAVFINESPVYRALENAEKERLFKQIGHMTGYASVLRERIAAFDA